MSPAKLPAPGQPGVTFLDQHAAVASQPSAAAAPFAAAQQAQQAQQAQHAIPAVKMPTAMQPVQQLAAAQQQPASPGGRELTHLVDFMTPEAESVLHHREFAAPAEARKGLPMQRIAELQREGQQGGSGGSLEGESEMQPIAAVPAPAAELDSAEEAEYGQMVQELQQVDSCLACGTPRPNTKCCGAAKNRLS